MRVGLIQSAEDLSGTRRLSKRDPLQPDCMSWDIGLSCVQIWTETLALFWC